MKELRKGMLRDAVPRMAGQVIPITGVTGTNSDLHVGGGWWDTIATRELKRLFELHGRHRITVGNVCAILMRIGIARRLPVGGWKKSFKPNQ